jgi:hypothetical protein
VKLRTRLLALAGSLAMVGGMMTVAAGPVAAASVTVNVHNAHVTCNTLTGGLKFATKLTLSGPTTGQSNTITVKGAVAGCTSPEVNGGGSIFKGALTGTIHTVNGSTNCTGLSGLSTPGNTTGTSRIIWTAPTGYIFTPTTTVGTAQKPVTDVGLTQSKGGTYTVDAGQAPWAGSYGQFQIGTAFGTDALTASGATNDFIGNAGWFSGVLQQDVVDIIGLCGKGLTAVTFGIGGIHAGSS